MTGAQRFTDKVVIITGGASGIGRDAALCLLEKRQASACRSSFEVNVGGGDVFTSG
jgi:NAD(P)-dependent dehydrogenase (short-subunit alcohol dehydrogenase family)